MLSADEQTFRDLMTRMGHDSMAAALADDERDEDDGTAGVLVPAG